jgi:hypothetical protein
VTALPPGPAGFEDGRRQAIDDQTLRSERGRLLPPDLDDRRWQDLVDEASVLINRYARQWTDRSPSDIGITLIELFAWLTESLIYRLNRVPDKHYVTMLGLLGITRSPQLPARTLLTFTAAGGAVEVAAGTAAQTRGTETEAPIVFETDAALTVVPASQGGIVRVDSRGPATEQPRDDAPRGSIPLTLARGDGVQVCVALDAQTPQLGGVDLYVEPFRPPIDRQAVERVEWVCSVATSPQPDALAHPSWSSVHFGPWHALEVLSDSTGGLVRPGVVRLRVPDGAEWTEQDPRDEDPRKRWSPPGGVELPVGAHRWLGVRITNDSPPPVADSPPPVVTLHLDRILLNTTTASGVGTVTYEVLGRGTGAPRQVLPLARRPLYARPGTDTPYDHVRITVAGVEWQAVDVLPAGPGQCYLLDPVAGEITFADDDEGTRRGTPPAPGQEIVAERYRYVSAGTAGNVPAGVVCELSGATRLASVTNPVPAIGGVDEEPVEETRRRAPEVLRHRGRAVTAEDYELIARQAAPGIAIVRCLPPRLHGLNEGAAAGNPWTYGNLQRAPGVVNVLVVPDLGPQVPEPVPSLALVQEVIRALDRNRPVGTCLHVDGPRYVRVGVAAEVTVFDTALDGGLVPSREAVFATIRDNIRRFLHPVHGRDGQGWRIGQSVFLSDLYQATRPREEIGFITSLTVTPEKLVYVTGDDPENQRPITDTIGEPSNHVRIADYELVCAGTVEVRPPGEEHRP